METLDVRIKGMDCADCTEHVKKAIKDVPDVEYVDVFLGAEKARITYNWTPPDLSLVKKAVSEAGYEAVIEEETSLDEEGISGASVTLNKLLTVLGLVAGLVVFVTIVGEWLGLFESFAALIPWYIWLGGILLGGWPIFRNVIRAAFKGQVISHTLMTLGVVAAVAVREWPTAAIVVLFMRVGDFVEGFTTGNARSAVRELTALAPQTAIVERDGNEVEVPIGEVKSGETVIVRPGEAIPVDGMVQSGSGTVDQSAISGESMPVEVKDDSRVFAASTLLNGMLKVRVTAVGAKSTFGRVIQLVEDAEANRADVQRAADRFAGYYLPVVAVIALLTYLFSGDALATAAVLVVACSCSFALATPIAMLASIGSGAREGLLIKGGKHIEVLDQVNTLFVDKTGTLTLGKPVITDVIPLANFTEHEVIQFAASAERYSEHPLAKAVLHLAASRDLPLMESTDFDSTPGVGVRSNVGGNRLEITNKLSRMPKRTTEQMENLLEQGKTVFFLRINNTNAAIFGASDEPRTEVEAAIRKLKSMGYERIILISGDREPVVRNLASELEIDYHAELLPEEKVHLVHNAQSRGETVAMIGDGINDAPALAQADVGIAMGETGSQIAIETAHVSLLREDWSLVPKLFEISRRTLRVVRMNILFTAIYNLAGLTLAALGILPPVLAAAAQSLPDLGILANSARLIKTK